MALFLRQELDVAAAAAIHDGNAYTALSCDEFGDCGSRTVTVIHHLDPDDVEAGRNNVVFGYSR